MYQSGALWSSIILAENVALPLENYTDLGPGEIRDTVELKMAWQLQQEQEKQAVTDPDSQHLLRATLLKHPRWNPPWAWRHLMNKPASFS